MAELFKTYLADCFERLRESLEGYSGISDNKRLFRLRVSIKKIRTCLGCMEDYQGKKEFKKTRKEFRKIFKSGGSLRELLIYHAWFKRHHFLRLAKYIGLPKQILDREKDFTKCRDKHSSELFIEK